MDDGFIPIADSPPGGDPNRPMPSGMLPSAFANAVDIARGGSETAGNKFLQTMAVPFQLAGEGIKYLGEKATGQPTNFQGPTLFTGKPAIDPLQLSVSGLKGLGKTVQSGVNQGAQTVEQVQKNPTLLDVAAMMGLGLGTGEASNLPMKPVSWALGKGADLINNIPYITKNADPALQEVAKAHDFPMTPGGLTGSNTHLKAENILSGLPLSGDVFIDKIYKPQLEALTNMRNQLIQNGAPTESIDNQISGLMAQNVRNQVIKASQEAFKSSQGEYSALNPKGPIPITNLTQAAKSLLDEQMKLPAGSRSSMISLLKDVSGGPEQEVPNEFMAAIKNAQTNPANQGNIGDISQEASKTFDYPTLQALRSRLNANIASADQAVGTGGKFLSSPEGRINRLLKGALDKDISSLGDPEFQQGLQKANSNYAGNKSLFSDNPYVKSVMQNDDPNKIIGSLKNALLRKNNDDTVGSFKKILGDQSFNDVADHMISFLTDKNGQFSPTQTVNSFNKIGDKALTNLLGEDRMKIFRPLVQLSQAARRAEQTAGNATTTGRTMGAMFVMMRPLYSLLRGNIAQAGQEALATAIGLPLAAKAYLSEPSQSFLTRQSPITSPDLSFTKYSNPLLSAINQAKTPGQLAPAQSPNGGFVEIR